MKRKNPAAVALTTKQLERDYRCDCGKLLFKGLLKEGKIEIKCQRCVEIKVFEAM